VPALVDSLDTLLCAGQLDPAAKTIIVNYVTGTNAPSTTPNFAYTTPTAPQMRDRVRAVVHQMISSPNFIIQR
jgi:hypothetical protein